MCFPVSETDVCALCSVTPLHPTLHDPTDCSPSGPSVHGIFQARRLKWVSFPTPRDLTNPGIEPTPLASPVLAGRFFTTGPLKLGFFTQPGPLKLIPHVKNI